MAETTEENHIMKNRNLKLGTSLNHLARLIGSLSSVGLLIVFLALAPSAKAADTTAPTEILSNLALRLSRIASV